MFDKMLLDYGKKFTDQWGGADPDKLIAHWAREMASYGGDEIKRGLAAMETRDWPPSLPEFKKMCRPGVDPAAAYFEAVEGTVARERGEAGKWSHPAVFWASVQVTAFDLKNNTYSQMKARWDKALADELAKGQWAPIPEALLALPEPGKSELSREKAAQMVTELKAEGVTKAADSKIDHKRWAKRIIEQAKKKDHGLSALQIRFAKEALADKRQA